MKKTKALVLSEKTILENFEGDKFLTTYQKWQSLEPKIKENILLAFTMQPTPQDWVKFIRFESKGKKIGIPYIEGWRAKRLLNLFFGFGNWSLEMQDIKVENGNSVVTGYLTIKWFDGTERRIPTAGRGRIVKSNPTTSMGDDTKGAITDAIKKAMNNMGFFHDVYSGNYTDEAENEVEKDTDEIRIDKKALEEALGNLAVDIIDGAEDVNERLERAEKIISKTNYNDLKLKVAELKKRAERGKP